LVTELNVTQIEKKPEMRRSVDDYLTLYHKNGRAGAPKLLS
jgi:hypothetical protein